MNIDFRNICQLNRSQHQAFEELCAQLARAEIPEGAQFYRKAPPDAGVECYAVLPNGDQWGWQAKYFDRLTSSQWRQIDDSVKTALKKHSRLVRYYVCVPLDRTHAQIRKWEEHVKKWQEWAFEKEMSVEFVWWGRHELLSRLTRPEHAGRVRFFFDVERFDQVWFEKRLEEAIRAAGPRYTPEIHVDLPIAREFEAFSWTKHFFDELKSHAKEIRQKINRLHYESSSISNEAKDIKSTISEIIDQGQQLLEMLSRIMPEPSAPLTLEEIVQQADQIAGVVENLAQKLSEYEQRFGIQRTQSSESPEDFTFYKNPFRILYDRLWDLERELYNFRESLEHAHRLASSRLLLITGEAGTGKTHLLCDIAKKRIQEGRPTVLLMGQRFNSEEEPWTQVLKQLDLRDLRVEEFVGALEAAAQAVGCRALVMIDALNEGMGRYIWPNHLDAFLAHLERSPWIGVVLAIRSPFENVIIPKTLRDRAVRITHSGFVGHEYDALKSFFAYYNIELPSTPLLVPEFSNPLFLKILCESLRGRGKHRLPRGFQGITKLFEFFLDAVNHRLALKLDFDPREKLVHQAVNCLAEKLARKRKRWLSRKEAKEIVDSFLPGREFSRSLFYGLLTEGVLLEEIQNRNDEYEEIIFIAYEHLADHLIAKYLLDQYLNQEAPEESFQQGGPLGFLWNPEHYVPAGLLEALCIQVPERTGRELLEFVPSLKERWNFKHAFLQSLIWRDKKAFSDNTSKILFELIKTDLYKTLDVLLTVSGLPEHPFNAKFLDTLLRKYTMPDRDAWWSIYLYYAYSSDEPSAVRRIVDWTLTITSDQELENEVVDLCSTTLAWMLTTSNRFLRDRATKALVNLLSGRLDAVIRLLEHFADVDDLYVMERIYAVAYGTAMRSYDPKAVGALAECVYRKIFANGMPPVHILLRDYARGVIERALYLGADINVDVNKIRPPYQSTWPHIPTEEEIKPYLPDWSRGFYNSGDLEWARNRIGSSVMEDDFARYVIGTNSGLTNWLSLRLDEPPWQSPDERLSALIDEFSDEEKKAWQAFEAADKALREVMPLFITHILNSLKNEEIADTNNISDLFIEKDTNFSHIQELEHQRGIAFSRLKKVLTQKHLQQLEAILTAKEKGKAPPRFDLKIIQRYILKRVFDLGWTIERFGHFDRFAIGYQGRAARKAERIGKKYQWIAYHEIMAYIADHFQYRNADGATRYEGPWQEWLRDIDPSCLLRTTPSSTSWDGHPATWWCPVAYEAWEQPTNYREWVKKTEDLPRVEDLLIVTHPRDGSRWVNLQGFFLWRQKPSTDRETTEVETREFWYIYTAYFVRKEDVKAFMNWARSVDFWGQWMPEPPEVHRMFLGEYGWAPAFHYFQQIYYGDTEWLYPREDCPIKVKIASFNYIVEANGFDCSIDEGYTLRLPAIDLINILKLRWIGKGADFVNTSGRLVAFDPTVYEAGAPALLIRLDDLIQFLNQTQLALCWTVIGEKSVLGPGLSPAYHASLRLSGAYMLCSMNLEGFLRYFEE